MKSFILESAQVDSCTYCGTSAAGITLDDLAERTKNAFRQHYQVTASEPDGLQWIMLKDPESTYDWEREGDLVADIIQDEAGVDEKIANDVHKLLDYTHSDYDDPTESEFDSEIQYKKRRQYGSDWHYEWSVFQH